MMFERRLLFTQRETLLFPFSSYLLCLAAVVEGNELLLSLRLGFVPDQRVAIAVRLRMNFPVAFSGA